MMVPRVNCTGTVKDRITGQSRQCRKTASADQTPALCHICQRTQRRSSNPHIAAEPTPPATPFDSSDTTTGLARQNADPTITPRKAGRNAAPTTDIPTPHKASQLNPTHATPHFSTPQKAIQKSTSDSSLPIRRDVFCSNLKELILVKVDCEKKIDFFCGKVKVAVAWEELDNMKRSLLMSEAWKDWLTEMAQSHNARAPLRAQSTFSELLTTAQSILVENMNDPGAKPHCFRNLRDESIGFNAPHDPQKSLNALRPDVVVVRREHLDSLPPRYDQFLCAMEHKRSNRVLSDGQAIQDSLIRSIQIFNDGFFRQYLYSAFIAGTRLRLFQLDRGSIVYFANDLNIQKHPEVFLKFVAWLSFSSPEQLGCGSSLNKIGKVPIQCEWDKPSKRPNAEILDTRGTTVWTVRELKPAPIELDKGLAQLTLNDGTPMILKMQWAYEAREKTEADFLDAISDMSGVPKLIAYHAGASTKDFGNPGSEIKHMAFKLRDNKISIVESSYVASTEDTNIITPNNDNRAVEQAFRQQRWLLISYCGASINDRNDPISGKPFTTVDRLRALRSVICTISKLFCEKRIVHRDISANNICIAPASDSNHSAGNLIDFDMANFWGAGGSGAKSRTGTPLYMAVTILYSKKPPTHLPWYDIESVFWVLLISEGKRSIEMFEVPTGTDLVTLGGSKFHLIGLLSWRELMESAFMRGPVGKLLCKLRAFLFDYNWTPTQPHDARVTPDHTYEADRFKTGKKDGEEDMEDALKTWVEVISTWFDECIDELLASEDTK